MSATTTASAASIVSMGQSSKGNPVVRIGQVILNRSCAADVLTVLDNPSELAVLRTLLMELVGLQAVAMAEKAAKAAAKVDKASAPTPPPVAPVTASLSPSETLAAISASRDVVKQDRKAMRGERPQVLPSVTPPAKPVTPPAEPAKPTIFASDERSDLYAEGKALGMGPIHAYGSKWTLETLRARVAAKRPVTTPPVAQPVKPTTPPVIRQVKATRTLIADFVNTMPDGSELYTAVWSDGTYTNELIAAAKIA